tara:strand:+ start:242 stop:376 length:135 start_codon:yes stop_codon:yes gene_type:complete
MSRLEQKNQSSIIEDKGTPWAIKEKADRRRMIQNQLSSYSYNDF